MTNSYAPALLHGARAQETTSEPDVNSLDDMKLLMCLFAHGFRIIIYVAVS